MNGLINKILKSRTGITALRFMSILVGVKVKSNEAIQTRTIYIQNNHGILEAKGTINPLDIIE